MPAQDLAALRNAIVERFDLHELRTFCLDLGVDFDSLGGEVKEAKARELVLYMQRRCRLDELSAQLDAVIAKDVSHCALSAAPPANDPNAHVTHPASDSLNKWLLWGVLAAVVACIGTWLAAFPQIQSLFQIGPPTSSSFIYQLTVQDQAGTPVQGARVEIQVGDDLHVVEITDDAGFAVILIDSDSVGKPARLTVMASRSENYTEFIILTANELPSVVQLRALSAKSTATPPP